MPTNNYFMTAVWPVLTVQIRGEIMASRTERDVLALPDGMDAALLALRELNASAQTKRGATLGRNACDVVDLSLSVCVLEGNKFEAECSAEQSFENPAGLVAQFQQQHDAFEQYQAQIRARWADTPPVIVAHSHMHRHVSRNMTHLSLQADASAELPKEVEEAIAGREVTIKATQQCSKHEISRLVYRLQAAVYRMTDILGRLDRSVYRRLVARVNFLEPLVDKLTQLRHTEMPSLAGMRCLQANCS